MKDKRKLSILIVVLFVSQIAISASLRAEILYPVISNIHHTPVTPSPEDKVIVLADVVFSEGLSYVILDYIINDETEWHSINMRNNFENVFYAEIPSFQINTNVIYRIMARTLTDQVQISTNYTYTVYEYLIPTISNVLRDPYQPMFDETVNITANVFDVLGIQSVFLKYRFDTNATTQVPMSYDINNSFYYASIPNTPINTSVLYWVEATNNQSHTSNSQNYHYISLGFIPYIYDIWTEPFNATETLPLTFYVDLFHRCIISDSYIYYKIDGGATQTLNLTNTEYTYWTSESIPGDQLTGGSIIEYWAEFNYTNDENYHLLTSTHYFKTVVEYNPPTIDNFNIYPVSIVKGDDVSINITVIDQSIINVECIYSIPGLTTDTHLQMDEIENTDIWTTTIFTSDLPENKSVVITIKASDINGEQTFLYSGFFINDGSNPILYGIEDIREQQICHTWEHTLYVYVNDTSEIDFVKLEIWTENGSTYYGEYYMIKGGEYLYYYTLDNAPFEIDTFTWISYKFIAQDIYGYYTESAEQTFFVYDYTEPIFTNLEEENVDYHLTDELHLIIDDQEGTGVQAASIIYSDDNWVTNNTLSLNYMDNNEYKTNLPLLTYGSTRHYYYTAIDFANNPSQSIIFTCNSVDLTPPTITNYELNSNIAVSNADNSILIELWLEDVNTINLNQFKMRSQYDQQWYTWNISSGGPSYYFTTINYNFVSFDTITYYFTVGDTLGHVADSSQQQFVVIDEINPSLSITTTSQGSRNVLADTIIYWQELIDPVDDLYEPHSAYWINDSVEFYLEVTSDDETELDKVYFHYSYGVNNNWEGYMLFSQVGTSTTYTLTIQMAVFSAEKNNDNYEIIDEEDGRFYFKVTAKDTSNNIQTWTPVLPFELWDGESPTITNLIKSHTSIKGTEDISFTLTLNDNYKGFMEVGMVRGTAFIKFKYETTDTGWLLMSMNPGLHEEWSYTWTTPSVSSNTLCDVWFKIGDLNAIKFFLAGPFGSQYWVDEQKDSWSNNKTYSDYTSFTIIDSTVPDVCSWTYNGPAWSSTNPYLDYSQTLYVDLHITDTSGINTPILWYSNTTSWINSDNMELISGTIYDGTWRAEISSSYLYSVYDSGDVLDIHFKVVVTDTENNFYEETSPGWLDIRDFVDPVITSLPTCSHSQIYQGQTIRFDISAHDYGKGIKTAVPWALRISIDGGSHLSMTWDGGDDWYCEWIIYGSIGVHNVQFLVYDMDLSGFYDTSSNIYETAYNNLTYEVLDGFGPTIESSTDWTYGGSAWKGVINDENWHGIDNWLIDLDYDLSITVQITDASGIQYAWLYYSNSRYSFSNYVTMSHTTGNNYQATITASMLQSKYTSSSPESSNDLLFFKVYAVDDSSSHNSNDRESFDDDIHFEMWDYKGPTYSNYIVPSSASIGSQVTIKVDVTDCIGVYSNYYKIKFVCGGTTYGYYDMTRISGDKFDGTYQYIWTVQNHHNTQCTISFKFKDVAGIREYNGFFEEWYTYDYTSSVETTDSTQTFQIYDNTDPVISNHYASPSDPEYNEQFRFYAVATDAYTSISSVWVEWWVGGVKQTDISMPLDSGTTYKSALVGTYSYNTQIKYIIHAKDINNNEETTSQIIFYVEDSVIPIASNTYHTPNPIPEGTNPTRIYVTYTDAGSGITTPQFTYWKGSTQYGYYTMSFYSGNTYYYDINTGTWPANTILKYQTKCTDVAGNTHTSGLYGPYSIQDGTPPTISSVTRSPVFVHESDDVTVTATVTDSGGIDYVRLYYTRAWPYSSTYVTMTYIGNNKYQGTFYASTRSGQTDTYYVKAWDNAGNYAQTSTYSYVTESGGGWPPFVPQPIVGLIHSVDLSDYYDEGFLHLDKKQYIFNYPELIKFVIVEYKKPGEPSWHSVVAIDNGTHYSSYIASATSLILNYRCLIYLLTEQTITSETNTIELIDLTIPSIEVSYSPIFPQMDDIILFTIETFDSSGIKGVTCYYTTTGVEWTTEEVNLTNEKHVYSHILSQSIRFKFEVEDYNGHTNHSKILEFMVFSDIEDLPNDTVNTWSDYLFIIVGISVLVIIGTSVLIPRFLKNIRRN